MICRYDLGFKKISCWLRSACNHALKKSPAIGRSSSSHVILTSATHSSIISLLWLSRLWSRCRFESMFISFANLTLISISWNLQKQDLCRSFLLKQMFWDYLSFLSLVIGIKQNWAVFGKIKHGWKKTCALLHTPSNMPLPWSFKLPSERLFSQFATYESRTMWEDKKK